MVLLEHGFDVNFHSNGVNFYLGSSYYGRGYFLDRFVVMDVDYGYSNVSFSLFASSNTSKVDVNIWHARLAHIG